MGDEQGSLPGVPAPESSESESVEGERAVRLKRVDRRQLLLRTIDVERLIEESHPARAIWEFVGRLDLSGYTEQVRSVAGSAGRPAYDPHLLVSLWVYSYSQGVSSARAIERLCEHEPGYQWLTGMEVIGAHTLSDFRVAHAERLRELFVQTLGLLSAEGLVSLERVTQDGTKVRANTSSKRFRSRGRVETYLEAAREAVEALEAEPEEETSGRKKAAQRRARRERQERLESALKQFDELKKAKSRVERVSTTDPDARVMYRAEGGTAPAYNVQLATDAAHGLIVDVDATQSGSDYRQLSPAMERVEKNLKRSPEQVVVDGGYLSNQNIVDMARRGIELFGPEAEPKSAAGNRRKSYQHYGVSANYEASQFVFDESTNTYLCPEGKRLRYDAKEQRGNSLLYRYKASKQDCQACPAKAYCCPRTRNGRSIQRREPLPEIDAFQKRMQTQRAQDTYKTRAQVAEFPNLWIKAKFGLRQFHVRGLEKVRSESIWAALTYDIVQWIRLRWKPRLTSMVVPA